MLRLGTVGVLIALLCACTANSPFGAPAGPPDGAGGAGGTASEGGASTAAEGLPCEVSALVETYCVNCHSDPPRSNAPTPLLSLEHFLSTSDIDPVATIGQRAVLRMADDESPMPPAPGTRPSEAERAAFSAWVTGGMVAGDCGAGGGPPDPFAVEPTCSKGTSWDNGNDESSRMNPGEACIACHTEEDEGPTFQLAGTVYLTGHEPNDCNGGPVDTTDKASVVVTDANGKTITMPVNAAGNFYKQSLTKLATPYVAKVLFQGRERIMAKEQTNGDCNSCHTQDGEPDGDDQTPGRIVLP